MSTPKKSLPEQASILVLGKVASMVAEGLTPLLIVRLLGKADVGALSGLLLIYSTVAVLLTAGFPQAVLYFLADRGIEERWSAVRRITEVMLVIGVLCGLVLFGMGVWGDDVLTAFGTWFTDIVGGDAAPTSPDAESVSMVYLQLMAVYPLLDLPVRILPNVLIAEERTRWAAGISILRGVGLTAAQLVPAALGFGLWGIVGGLIVFGVINFGVFRWVLRLLYKGVRPAAVPVTRMHLLRFSFPLGITDVVSTLNKSVDRYLVVIFLGAIAFAEYRVGAWQIPLIPTVAYSVGSVYMPRFVELFNEGKPEKAIGLWRHSIQKVSLIVVPVCLAFIVIAEEFVTVAFTKDYIAATPVFQLYCVFTIGRVASFGSVMVAAGKPGYVLRSAGVALVSNIIISTPLVFALGMVGPALGTVLAFIPTVIAYCWYIGKAVGMPFRKIFPVMAYLKTIAVGFPPCALAVAVKEYGPTMHPIVGMIVLSAIVLVGYGVLGTVTRQIKGEDWRFVWRWLRLKTV